ncbi:MAG TPA: hypothetical protein VHC22_30835 [Pirellulales bacterium]|nr:hypothetical protein [Pirellulales bacterium]
MLFERSRGQRRSRLKPPSGRVLSTERLESRALAAAVGVTPQLQDPIAAQATPVQATSAGGLSTMNQNTNFATNGPNPATSAGAEVANPYLGNNPWLDDLATAGTGQSAAGPLGQQYFTGLQEYVQYEQAIQDISAQQATQQVTT